MVAGERHADGPASRPPPTRSRACTARAPGKAYMRSSQGPRSTGVSSQRGLLACGAARIEAKVAVAGAQVRIGARLPIACLVDFALQPSHRMHIIRDLGDGVPAVALKATKPCLLCDTADGLRPKRATTAPYTVPYARYARSTCCGLSSCACCSQRGRATVRVSCVSRPHALCARPHTGARHAAPRQCQAMAIALRTLLMAGAAWLLGPWSAGPVSRIGRRVAPRRGVEGALGDLRGGAPA